MDCGSLPGWTLLFTSRLDSRLPPDWTLNYFFSGLDSYYLFPDRRFCSILPDRTPYLLHKDLTKPFTSRLVAFTSRLASILFISGQDFLLSTSRLVSFSLHLQHVIFFTRKMHGNFFVFFNRLYGTLCFLSS
jgi:hypothetical protein